MFKKLNWVALVATLAARIASADAYPWVDVGADDIQVTKSARTDLGLRLKLIGEAKQTIDIAVFEMIADQEVGLPILSALRQAADRGVKVRIITCAWAAFVKDHAKKAERYLVNPPTRVPVEVIVFGGGSMTHDKWRLSDQMHEKLLVTDGTLAIATGRGHSNSYINWLDTTFVIRGNLAVQAGTVFNQLWRTVSMEQNPFRDTKKLAKAPPVSEPPAKMEFSLDEGDEFLEISKWLAGERQLQWGKGGRGRVLHFDMIRQVQDLNYKLTHKAYVRAAALRDPIIAELVEKLKTAHELRFTTLSATLHPEFKAAIIAAADRGAKITIQVNGPASALDPFNFPWHYSLKDIVEVMEHGVQVLAFGPKQSNPWTYLHRKMAIVDDTVIFGSHNLNLPSSATNDELSFEVEDAGLAGRMRDLFDFDASITSVPVDLAAAQRSFRHSGFGRWLVHGVIGFF